MGTSQSRPEGRVGRLKRLSKVDLKTPLKGTFGRSATPSTTASKTELAAAGAGSSDYETPIYETKKPQPMPATVPCQYRTGKTLGSGTYAIVKEAIHVETGKYYACKVINKRLMEGREHMVRNEIAVLKRVSSGHPNIVTLHDYFETAHNLYLCFDLCTGGELFDRICAKGNYYEADARALVRTIFVAVQYIHDSGIVHRDLKPENLLFRTEAEDADIMIADFGLSRVMEQEKLNQLTEICGTPGYMAPEIFKKSASLAHVLPRISSSTSRPWQARRRLGHGRDHLLPARGYTPFDRDSQQQEMEAILAGDYKFEPEEYWQNVSATAKAFVRTCLTIDPAQRPTAAQALEHKQWLADEKPHFVPDPSRADGGPADLLPNVKKAFNAKQLWRKATSTIKAVNRMTLLAHVEVSGHAKIREEVNKYKEESARENLENADVTYQVSHDSKTSAASHAPAPAAAPAAVAAK
ncbi:calcium/calmodulin-dependent protein kinase [Pholiota molesta]|nr:calcium/calmodulin-dependent protein kinase [Pholiota molesta]